MNLNSSLVKTFYTLDRSTPLMARMTRPGGIHILYVVSLIKINIFNIFTPKCEKFHCADPMARAISRASLKIRARCLHQTGGFRGRPIECCHSNLPQTDPCCHGNQSLLFEQKIGYNSAIQEICPRFLHQGLFGADQFNCGSKICLRPTPVAMVTKI